MSKGFGNSKSARKRGVSQDYLDDQGSISQVGKVTRTMTTQNRGFQDVGPDGEIRTHFI